MVYFEMRKDIYENEKLMTDVTQNFYGHNWSL